MRVAEPVTKTAAEVGERVKLEMDRQKIRQTTVAHRLRMSQQAVSRRIRGAVPFDVDELVEVARLLDVDPSTFMGRAA
jgi:transcriptional regulator with XRE-family HTH domain